ncbi:MAG: cbb3-type cytochrome c oxidase subunit 3 [Gammaproteobacteria bacterium]|nr:cbb3-type cytochrome c oxidase subunit 3 [Gammaproteobacteria bacterium]
MSTNVQIIWTVLAFVIFVGIVIWAWGSGRKAEFDKAARMAMDDDEPISNNEKN